MIGIRYTELDRIEDQIAEYMASLEAIKAFKPSQNLKQLYRDVAKLIHPDLATDEKERLRRQELMAQVNQAYENGDDTCGCFAWNIDAGRVATDGEKINIGFKNSFLFLFQIRYTVFI